ncbi:MAG: hypothetical protein Q8L66_02290 [Caulobacter sp.]|nr:hypothetical protein [Caulobacter sp.]
MSANDSMHRHTIRLIPFGLSLSIFLAITFALCAIGELIPGLEGIHFLSVLSPDIDWTQPRLLLAGVAWAFMTGWYVALVFGSLYNLFNSPRP